MPLATKKLAQTEKYDAVICVGVVIRGDTPHLEYVASEVTKGIANVALETGVPAAFGVLITENIEQAIERAGAKRGNKCFSTAQNAIEMANLIKQNEFLCNAENCTKVRKVQQRFGASHIPLYCCVTR